MAVADRNGLPVSICVESATPHELKLAVPTLVQMVIPEAPRNPIGDNAYDSDKLDEELSRYGIEPIAPHRRNRKNRTQDLRRLRRYTLLIDGRRIPVKAGEEFLIPRGVLHGGEVLAGTRTIHVFGGHRADRERQP